MNDILFRSPRLLVRRVPAADATRIVVTFDAYHAPGFEHDGFGEAYLTSKGIGAIHVLTNGNDWFQYAEMADALLAIRAACADAERILTYGSSMGGYASIHFADAIGAQAALALSPQFSVDPRKAPFETRWAQDQRRIRFLPAIEDALPSQARTIVAYDSRLAADRAHAGLIAAATPSELLALPYAGHPAGPFLVETGLLHALVVTSLDGGFDRARFLRAAHARRTRSSHFFANLAARQPARREACALRLAERAAVIGPNYPAIQHALALQLSAAKRFDAAIAAHERAIALDPIADYHWGLSKTLFKAGDLPRALEVARVIQHLAPGVAGYHAWAAKIQELQGDAAGQLADLRKARRADPRNRDYRLVAGRLEWQARFKRWRRALFGA